MNDVDHHRSVAKSCAIPAVLLPDCVLRHPRERLSKCTLQPLQGRQDIVFHTAKPGLVLDATGYILLQPDAPPLTAADGSLPLLLLDSTWSLLPALQRCLRGSPLPRSIPPNFRSAYPRVSKLHSDPHAGLASVEALFIARIILDRETSGLLDHYFWRDAFLAQFD